MRVYHLLSSQNALSDIALQRIRLSRYGDLNDPFELFAANLEDKDVRRAMREFKEEFHRTTGLLCFSRHWEHPVLWSHYASKHRGVCLGFDLNDKFAVEILYSEERIPIRFKNSDTSQGFDETLVNSLLRTKFVHWKYEEEIRIVVHLDEATVEDGGYFLPFSDDLALREVILGPLCTLPIEGVRSLVDSICQSVKVRKARLAFKRFEVIPDQRYEDPPTT